MMEKQKFKNPKKMVQRSLPGTKLKTRAQTEEECVDCGIFEEIH
jgi:hypothetical protein